jgi:hypothetical protein
MHFPALTAFAFATAASAQSVNDIGLQMDGGLLTVIYGQSCGPLACAPFIGGNLNGGGTRNLIHWSAQNTAYAIAIGLPGPCVAFPGIGNSLLLDPSSIVTLAVGATVPAPTAACRQGQARAQLTLPPVVPPGIVFRLQSLGISPSTGSPALGPAIEVTTV